MSDTFAVGALGKSDIAGLVIVRNSSPEGRPDIRVPLAVNLIP